VYSNGIASWETSIHEADPSIFERAGGANVYGIKTAVGVPLVADGIGRIGVALYSTSDIEKDQVMLDKFIQDFKAWNPEPKWKLVIDLGSTSSKANKQVVESAVLTEMVHYSHPKQGSDDDQKPAPAPVATMTSLKPGGSAFATVTPPNVETSSTEINMCHEHAPTKPPPIESSDDSMERTIASLLGNHMPSSESPAAALLPHFMSLRLMLLRVRERRTVEENEKLDILKRSFVDYSKGRTGAELAILLAKDWMFLQPNFGMPAEMSQHESHAMPPMPVPLPAYSLAPSAASQPTSMRMIVHKHSAPAHGATNFAARSRSVSASSEASVVTSQFADIVPEA